MALFLKQYTNDGRIQHTYGIRGGKTNMAHKS